VTSLSRSSDNQEKGRVQLIAEFRQQGGGWGEAYNRVKKDRRRVFLSLQQSLENRRRVGLS
jgi:hypothetical protein